MRSNRIVFAALLVLLSVGLGCQEESTVSIVDGHDRQEHAGLRINESAIAASRDGSRVDLRIPIEQVQGLESSGELALSLRTLDGKLIDAVRIPFSIEQGSALVEASLEGVGADEESGALAKYVIHYEALSSRAHLWGRRSLFAAMQQREVHVLSADEFVAGSVGSVRIVARDPVSGTGLADARVRGRLELEGDDGVLRSIPLFEQRTDEHGVLAARMDMPAEALQGTLLLELETEAGSEVIARPVKVVQAEKILFSTDKPIYQPGQTIHMRALALRRPELNAAADVPLRFEARDGKGNKIFKVERESDAFGVAAAELRLARELNMGDFALCVSVGEAQSCKTVLVDRYVLPKFKLGLSTDRGWYHPGETVQASVEASYLFGKAVAGASYTLEAKSFDVGFQTFAQQSGVLDEQGQAAFSLELPSYLVGGQLESGAAFVQLDLNVTDSAGQTQSLSRQLTVAQSGLVLNAIPRSKLLPGQPATYYVVATDPTGMPKQAQLSLSGPDFSLTAETDSAGIAELSFTCPSESVFDLNLNASTSLGQQSSLNLAIDLRESTDQGAIALLSDKAIYRVGEKVELQLLTYGETERVFLDVLRDAQTLLTKTIDVQGSNTTFSYDLDASSTGSLRFEVYYASASGRIVRSSKRVLVEPADELQISASMDAEEYRPGESARVFFEVKDAQGAGVQAALGISIVDEAVFALQEMQPGLAKLFFAIEQALLEPRFELHGFSASEVLTDTSGDAEQRERAAQLLMASADDLSPYAIEVNTLADAKTMSKRIVEDAVKIQAGAVFEKMGQLLDSGLYGEDDALRLAAAVDGSMADPWGQGYRVRAVDGEVIVLSSAGPDEAFGSEDDVELRASVWSIRRLQSPDGDGLVMGAGDGDWAEPNAVAEENDEARAEGAEASVRVRKHFPETLLFEPALITDADGRASLDVALADSITTWRMSTMASTVSGRLASGSHPIRVFQPFFIDIDFPVTLTQGDELSVPVVVYNYLETSQSVSLRVDQSVGDWFSLLDGAEQVLVVSPGAVTATHFRVRVERVGVHPFRVFAMGSSMSDAIERSIEVLPDGERIPISISGRLDADVSQLVSIPTDAVPASSALFVKLYPGMFAQVVEGLDSLLQLPSGCFEQTSSTTYPNVLALRYMRASEQVTPEIELKASEYIALGYQRLLSYECSTGGFEWFGNDPAHRILTAYGLLEFTDMAEVFAVEPALIQRTQAWLLSTQESDGRFRAAAEGIHEGATNHFTDSDLRATAYVTYALLYSGYRGPASDKAISYLQQNLSSAQDAYTLALIANALLLAAPSSSSAAAAIEALVSQAKLEPGRSGSLAYWQSGTQSLYYSSGETMNMETTAMALLALIASGSHAELVEQGVSYLLENKDAFGNWSSTQATILSLRVFLAMLESRTQPVDAELVVSIAGQQVQTLHVDASNSDLMRLVDLSPYTMEGDNLVTIKFTGSGAMMYQIAGRYYLPWDGHGPSQDELLAIEVEYDRQHLEVDDIITATATVHNRGAHRLDMIVVDLGVPPGFDVLSGELEAAVADGRLSKVELTGRQIIVYLYGLDAGASLSFSYQLQARMPLEAQTPPSQAYLYYDPAVSAEAEPIAVTVE
ncbi:MAG: MG2 domain-containing protein [Myxococcota bacterium]|jgi:uncharacterized protein YfaS (alpha-2-macroglobulin family)|nr:MG2 domain-containing protein [Myxococcota bacterium]